MRGVRSLLDRMLGGVLAALMGASVLNVLWQVTSRHVVASPGAYTDELARYLLVWIGLLGAAFGVGRRIHVAMDWLPARLDARFGAALADVADVCVIVFALAVWVFGGAHLVALTASLGQTSASLGVPLAAVYAALPVSGVVVTAYSLLAIRERHEARREAHRD